MCKNLYSHRQMMKIVRNIILMLLSLGISAAPSAAETQQEELIGKTVTVIGGITGTDKDRFLEAIKAFEEQTGVDVIFEGTGDLPAFVKVQMEDGIPPDVILFPQPGLMADMARQGHLLDLSDIIDVEQLARDYSQTWIVLGTVDGRLVGVWYRASVKSLVWYPVPAFEEAGYRIPETWEELLALSDQLVADGRTPWCIGMESETASGWVGTDWVEDIMLRTAGADAYDRWVVGDLQFDSPEVRQAFEIFGQILFNPAYVLGGTSGVSTTNWRDAAAPLFEDPPGCWLHRQASFIVNFFPDDVQNDLPRHTNAFYLPPIESERGKPVLGAGDVFSITSDRPEVRAFIKFIITPEATEPWVKRGGFLSPNKGVPFDWYPDEITRRQAQILVDATIFRFDGSDLMPGEVGTGTFWTEMMKWVNGQDLETTLKAIDASWPDE